jgi:hypothetical protein
LLTAIVGLLTYLMFLKLRVISLGTIVTISAVLSTVIVAIAPGPGQLILIRIAPGVVIAFVAAILQRVFGRTPQTATMTVQNYDESTIFTTEQPAMFEAAPTLIQPPTDHGQLA